MPYKQVAVTLDIIRCFDGADGGDLELYGKINVSKIRLTDDGPLIMESKTFWEVSVNNPQAFPSGIGLSVNKREDFILRPGQELLFAGNLMDEDDSADDPFIVEERRLKYENINESSDEYDFIVYANEGNEDFLPDMGKVIFTFKVQYISGGTI